jgi:hypothetical protein
MRRRGENASAIIPTICGTSFVDFGIVAVALFKIKHVNLFANGVNSVAQWRVTSNAITLIKNRKNVLFIGVHS